MNKKSFSILSPQRSAGFPTATIAPSIKSSSDTLHDSVPEPETLKEEVTRIIYKSIRITNQLRSQL